MSMGLGLQAQETKIGEIQKLVTAYETKKEIATLGNAAKLLNDLLKKQTKSDNLQTNILATKVYSHMLSDMELEEPIEHEMKLNQAYDLALGNDKNMSYRFQLLSALYKAKNEMITSGKKAYEEENYDLAYAHYKNALASNDLEIKYPKYMSRDTTILFTSAVFAKMAGENKAAIESLEAIIDMDYNRKDAYDYLIELYNKEGNEKRATQILNLKNQRYPE